MGRYDVNEEKNEFWDEKLMNDGDDDDDDKNEKREWSYMSTLFVNPK